MSDKIKLLGISGSLRKGSLNTAALKVAVNLCPAEAEVEIFDLSNIPLYNGDLEASGFPSAVTQFHQKISAAHGILFATPEYNYSIPGVLKNAIDWASRPAGKSPLQRKPAGIIGASRGGMGTSRAQYHLRQVAVALDMPLLNQPEVFISRAHEKFDPEGKLIDPKIKESITVFMQKLVAWTKLHTL